MSLAQILPKYTYEDYLLWEGDWEMIEGMPVAMAPAPMRIHQNIANQILFEFNKSLEESECKECEVSFEVDWKVTNDTVLRPDIVFTCGDHHERYLTKAPKIIIEVASPSTVKNDETIKFSIYEDEKVEYYVIVYPEDLIAKAYKLKDDRYIKIGDFSTEKLKFDALECEIEVDFEKVFKRFRK